MDREHRRRKWYDAAHCHVLNQALRRTEDMGITDEKIRNRAAGKAPRPWTEKKSEEVRRQYQRAARQLIQQQSKYDAHNWTRHKLSHWGFRDRLSTERSLKRLQELQGAVPPRVMAAVIGLVWNKWPTARRQQRRGMPCLLGCGTGEDSVEHYCCCRVSRTAGSKWLGIQYRVSQPIQHWTLAAPQCAEADETRDWWSKVALLEYAVMRTTNSARHRGGLQEEDALRAVRQGLLEAVRGHPRAANLL